MNYFEYITFEANVKEAWFSVDVGYAEYPINSA